LLTLRSFGKYIFVVCFSVDQPGQLCSCSLSFSALPSMSCRTWWASFWNAVAGMMGLKRGGIMGLSFFSRHSLLWFRVPGRSSVGTYVFVIISRAGLFQSFLDHLQSAEHDIAYIYEAVWREVFADELLILQHVLLLFCCCYYCLRSWPLKVWVLTPNPIVAGALCNQIALQREWWWVRMVEYSTSLCCVAGVE